MVTPASSGAICFSRYVYTSESVMSELKLAQRRAVPDFSSWWFTQRSRMASGDSFMSSSMRSFGPSRFVRPGQCSSVI